MRTEHGKQAYLDTRQAVLDRLETGIGEPGDNGVAASIAEFRATWGDLANSPHSDAARSQVLATGVALADAINLQARNFDIEASDQRMKLNVLVTEVQTLAADLAATNKAIGVANLDGADAGNLMDQRDLIGLRLAELTGGTGTVNAAGGLDFDVKRHRSRHRRLRRQLHRRLRRHPHRWRRRRRRQLRDHRPDERRQQLDRRHPRWRPRRGQPGARRGHPRLPGRAGWGRQGARRRGERRPRRRLQPRRGDRRRLLRLRPGRPGRHPRGRDRHDRPGGQRGGRQAPSTAAWPTGSPS